MITSNIKNESIGEILVQAGKLTPDEVAKVSEEQNNSGMRFGDCAIKLGLLTKVDLDRVLSEQFEFSYFEKTSDKFDKRVLAALEPEHPYSEKIRLLRVQLTLRWLNENTSIAIFGDDTGIGSSLNCANLAISFAQFGKKTLLVDANMRKPSQHNFFKLPNSVGLSQLLAGRTDVDAIQNLSHLTNLSILTSGALPPNPVELLGRSTMKNLVEQLESSYDVVIYDCPSVKEHSDGYILTSLIKGVVITSKKNLSKVSNFKQIVEKVDLSGGKIIGAVINEF